MSKLYFIDHESIKKTAKAIKKQNEKHNYTYILDELTKCLGYKSYNEYEHYLTNAFLNSQNKLHELIPLTQLTIPELFELNNNTIDSLHSYGIESNDLYFVNKIINNKKEIFKNHKRLSLKSYLYYLPFVFNKTSVLISRYASINKEVFNEILDDMRAYYLKSSAIEKNNTEYKIITKHETLKEQSKIDLRIRALYYFALSYKEGIIYDESIIIKMIFDGHDNDFIFDEIEHSLNMNLNNSGIDKEIPDFAPAKFDTQDYNSFFPYIKQNICYEKPLILGLNEQSNSVFIPRNNLFENIQIASLPGAGGSLIKDTIILQSLMNNRGFLNIDCFDVEYNSGKTVDRIRIEYITSLFNKSDDTFTMNYGNLNNLSKVINNNKIINFQINNNGFSRLTQSEKEKHLTTTINNTLENILNNYYDIKFRKKDFPYYVIIDNVNLNHQTYRIIKKLNNIGIYILHYSWRIDINSNFKNLIFSNDSIEYNIKLLSESSKDNLHGTPELLIGKNGPSKDGCGFSYYYDKQFQSQFMSKYSNEYGNYAKNTWARPKIEY